MRIEKMCVCEVCGKEYRTDKEAFACEESHEKEREKTANLKKDAEDTLSKLYNSYIETFHEMPHIHLSEEALIVIYDTITDLIDEAVNMFD